MASFMGLAVALVVGLIVHQSLPATGGVPLSKFVAVIAAFFAFYFAKRFFETIRPDSS